MKEYSGCRGLVTAAMGLWIALAGCEQFPNAFPSPYCADEGFVRLTAVDKIVNDPDLNEDEKIQQLEQLFCITDEQLPEYIDLFHALLER